MMCVCVCVCVCVRVRVRVRVRVCVCARACVRVRTRGGIAILFLVTSRMSNATKPLYFPYKKGYIQMTSS